MHIAINAHLLSTQAGYRGAGVSNYSRQLLQSLGQLRGKGETQHTFTAFVSATGFVAEGINLCAGSPYLQKPALRIAWEQFVLPNRLRTLHADLVHGLVNVLPLAGKTPGVVTVHDLSFLRLPDKFPAAKRIYLTRLCHASVARARHVITVSRQTADDLHDFFQTPVSKISVIPNGVDSRFVPGDSECAAQFRRAKGLPERFFLYLGTLEPRKNLEMLIRAFARWRSQTQAQKSPVDLVIAGGKGWFYEQIFRLVKELDLEDKVHFPGYVADEEVADWFRAAEGFVYPSLFEGFGLPVLEAMACGIPVLCSRAPSLLEVVGDAAMTVAAEDERGWAAALELLASQPDLRAELRQRGLTRAAQFSWERTAQATLAVYDHVG